MENKANQSYQFRFTLEFVLSELLLHVGHKPCMVVYFSANLTYVTGLTSPVAHCLIGWAFPYRLVLLANSYELKLMFGRHGRFTRKDGKRENPFTITAE